MSDERTQNASDFDFSVSQEDSPLGKYKPINLLKSSCGENISDQRDIVSCAPDQSDKGKEFSSRDQDTDTKEPIRSHYDFSASQEDSPVKEYKPLTFCRNLGEAKPLDCDKTDTVDISDQDKENSCSAFTNSKNEEKKEAQSELKYNERISTRRKVCYIHSKELILRCNEMIKVPLRVTNLCLSHMPSRDA